MATTRIMPLHVGKGRTESRAISDIIDYVANPKKTDDGRLITGYACDSRTVDAEFLLAKRQYIAATGRVRGADDVIAYHVRQSFRPGEITPEEANRLGVEFAKRFTKGNHAFVVCTHIDKSHIHNHIIWSSVSLEYDRKFRNFWGSTKAVRQLSDTICIENGLSIVENPKPHGKSYNKWLGDQAKPSHRELLRVAIDNALSQSPANFEELLRLLQESGCEVSKRGKSYRLKLPGWEKAARMDSLGEGYGLDDLQAVLSGKKAHTPRKKIVTQAETQKVNLLVDIQAIIREKGTSLQREDLVGCGEDVNGNCGIHDVGLGGQLVERQSGNAVHQYMAFVSPVELIPPIIVLVGGRVDAQGAVWVAFRVVFLGELAFCKGFWVVLLHVRHDGSGIQANEGGVHDPQFVQLPYQIRHNRL